MIKEYRKFFTPDDTADRLCYLADLQKGFIRVLEPHAGEGAIVDAIMRANRNAAVHAIEQNRDYGLKINQDNLEMLIIGDFMNVPLRPAYHRIIANPPFKEGKEFELVAHLEKMYSLLTTNGKMVSIVPKGFYWQFADVRIPLQNWAANSDGSQTEIEILVTFNGNQ